MGLANDSLLNLLREAHHQGDANRFGEILDQFSVFLKLIARKSLDPRVAIKCAPSDIVQETMLEAQQSFDDFRGNSESELISWLATILRSNVLNATRTYRGTLCRDVRRELSGQKDGAPCRFMVDRPHSSLTPGARMVMKERIVAIEEAIDRLPVEMKRVVAWRLREELPFSEIAGRLEKDEHGVRASFYRAIIELRRRLGNHDDSWRE